MGLPWSPAPIVPVPARWGTGVLSRGRLARFPLRCFLGRPSRGSLGGLGSPDAQTVGPSVELRPVELVGTWVPDC